MSPLRHVRTLLLAGAAAALATSCAAAADEPVFDDAFWKHWGDGRAELCSYDLVYPRYGAPRSGTAVMVFVTETFSHEARVKADPGRHPESDEYPVMKLNLVQDFATGVYDYNLMTSAFCAITSRDGRPPGSPTKVTFSSQEWCGNVFHELLPEARRVRSISHSYFDGEGDRERKLPYPQDALFEDALFHWARGWTAPVLEPGEARQLQVLRSTEFARMRHVDLEWEGATVSRGTAAGSVTAPAGTFDADTLRVAIGGAVERTWTFLVEADPPHRIVRWEMSDGRRAELVGSDRLAYWRRNDPGGEEALEALGLSPRPERTP